MYLGFHPSHITQKNQLTFPSKFEEITGKKLFISNWFERSLIVLPYGKAQEILNTILQGSASLLPEVRELESFLYINAEAIELDEKNRFVLPKRLREYAQIQTNAVFLGVNERIEIWDQDVYKDYGKIRELQIRETAIKLYNRVINKTHT